MNSASRSFARLLAWLGHVLGCWCCIHSARAQDYLTPADVVVHTEEASQEALKQSAGKASLRFLGMDAFPRLALTTLYDDNLVITDTNKLADVEWMIGPAVTLAAGDISLYLPGSVTLGQIRNLLNYSLLDDAGKPQRYFGIDYAPSINLFADHSRFNNVDHVAGFTGGYTFAKLILGLDLDYSHMAIKDNGVGDRITRDLLQARSRNRYEWTDRSAMEVNFHYTGLSYEKVIYQGYDEFRNEDWFDRKFGARFEAGAGIGLGLVEPQFSPQQTYEQGFIRALYRLTGKLNVRTRLGAEWRQYGGSQSDTLNPAFDLEGIYQPRSPTTFTLAAHRRTAPSFGADYNYEMFGCTAGVAQQLTSALDGELTFSYENVDYVSLGNAAQQDRKDDYFAVRASVGYEFNAHLKALLFYQWSSDESSAPQFTYANHIAGIRLSWRY